MAKQVINCSVITCKFQNNSKCTLDEIKVGNATDKVQEKDETACKSFEYEINRKEKEE